MAYREPTFNANILTDLLSTYLDQKSKEREKYYKAAEKANKPQLRTLGNKLVNVYQDGTVETVYEGPKKAESEYYDETRGMMVRGTKEEAYNKPSEKPPVDFQKKGTDYLESYQKRNPELNLKSFKDNLPFINTKEEYSTWRSDISKSRTEYKTGQKAGNLAESRQLIKKNAKFYEELGSDINLSGNRLKKDLIVRKNEKKALQKLFKGYGVNKKVYLKEDVDQLKGDYISIINSNLKSVNKKINIKKLQEIQNMDSTALFEEINRMNEILISKGQPELPIWVHQNRYKGFSEFGNLLESFENVTK